MEYVTVNKLEKYHPGYKDRDLIWAKIFFTAITGDPDWDLIESETDKWRLIGIILLELKAKKPLPNDNKYWEKYFNIKNRPMSLTLKMLHSFINHVTEESKLCNLEKRREENINREDKMPVKQSKLTDEEFISTLKANSAYKHINLDNELGRIDAWLLLRPNRKKTRRFVIAWLNRIEPPLKIEDKPSQMRTL